LPAVLYGCETWSLILREEQRLRVFKNRVLRRIFEPKGEEVTGGWRKKLKAYRILVGKPEVKKPVGRRRLKWEDNIKMDLRETVWGSMLWINLAQDRDKWRVLVSTVMDLRVPYNVRKFWSS
jgi:hypothetical protein